MKPPLNIWLAFDLITPPFSSFLARPRTLLSSLFVSQTMLDSHKVRYSTFLKSLFSSFNFLFFHTGLVAKIMLLIKVYFFLNKCITYMCQDRIVKSLRMHNLFYALFRNLRRRWCIMLRISLSHSFFLFLFMSRRFSI